ncbi:MAG TPA: carboxylesterase/lipase family protein [Candidatus Kryptonia bacterium]
MKFHAKRWAVLLLMAAQGLNAQELRHVTIQTSDGMLEGVVSVDGKVRTYKGIPYAAPPIGPLRWKPPQPVQPWTGVRKAIEYGPRAMQGRIFSDMVFNDAGPSEDCLYLNIWIPEANRPEGKLPVMVWIYGGGFVAGSSSEPRQDGGNLCKKGVIVVSFNYRMSVFGFLALSELSAESEHKASGNYGLLDQVAALKWVKANIATFGGDPDNVTIFGESAGSFSVSALMASPLAQGLFHRAIGESGAFFGKSLHLATRERAEKSGEEFVKSAFGTTSLEKLRAMPAQEILDASLKAGPFHFPQDIDGYFLPESCDSIYSTGSQSHVALLAGWNKDEGNYRSFFREEAPSPENYVKRADTLFGSNASKFLKLYPGSTESEVERSASDFEGDAFIAYSTWKWLERQLETGQSPVYRYEFDQPLPAPVNATPHASDIEFVFRVLSSRNLPWTQSDRDASELIASYWTNFAKTGDPNGPGLPNWPRYDSAGGYQVMHLEENAAAAPDKHRSRYEFLDSLSSMP